MLLNDFKRRERKKIKKFDLIRKSILVICTPRFSPFQPVSINLYGQTINMLTLRSFSDCIFLPFVRQLITKNLILIALSVNLAFCSYHPLSSDSSIPQSISPTPSRRVAFKLTTSWETRIFSSSNVGTISVSQSFG